MPTIKLCSVSPSCQIKNTSRGRGKSRTYSPPPTQCLLTSAFNRTQRLRLMHLLSGSRFGSYYLLPFLLPVGICCSNPASLMLWETHFILPHGSGQRRFRAFPAARRIYSFVNPEVATD
jgi:hypothetical protein